MGTVPLTLEWDDFIWALGTMCRVHRVPFDPGRVLQQFPPPYSLDLLLAAARALGLRAGARRLRATQVWQGELPCIVTLVPKSARGDDAGPPLPKKIELGLLTRADAHGVNLLQASGSPPGETLTREAFGKCFFGDAVHFSPLPPLAEAEAHEVRRFGFSWFVPEIARHRAIWRDVLVASLAVQIMALIMPLLTQIVIDKVIAHRTVNTLTVIGIALAIFVLFTAIMNWSRQQLLLHAGNRIDAVLANRVFEHLLALPARYFESRPTGTLVARVQAVEIIREFVAGAALMLLLDLPFAVVFLAVMLYYSVELTLVVLALLAIIVAISLAVAPVIRHRINRQFLLGARNQAFLTEYIAGIDTVKSLQMEPQLRQRFSDYLSAYLSAGFQTRKLYNGYNVVVQSLEQTVNLAALCLGAWLVMLNEGFTVGMLVAFQMFAGRLAQPLLRLAGLWQEFQQAAIAVKRLGDVMDAPTEPVAIVPQRTAASEPRIDLDGVRFRHSERSAELFPKGLNIAILPGQCTAITGPSGSGKSTLVKLLQGIYAPTEGCIRLNGHDTRYMPVNELRSLLGVVPQETVLFSGTIYANLLHGNAQVSFEEMIHACRLAEIHDAIEALPDGYQTWVGEHGTGLSGGQRQRIAIARALLKRPKILVFDEATSQLDRATADDLARTINRLKGRVTTIIVSHEVPRGLDVDRCLVLGDGLPART